MTKTKQSTNPFGAARPREEVLASKGIDFRLADQTIEEKARQQDDPSASADASRRHYHHHHDVHDDHSHSHDFVLTPDHLAAAATHDCSSSDEHLLTPSQTIHAQKIPSKVHSPSSFDDDATHETASVSTTHSHLTHSTARTSSSHATDPFCEARPREDVLADKGLDAQAVDARVERRAVGGDDDFHVFAGHHGGGAVATAGTVPHEPAVRTANLVSHNHPNYHQPTGVSKPSTSKPKKNVNPFGDARPREEVLADHGVDYRAFDVKIDRKIAAEHLTPEQEAQAEAIRLELTAAEEAFWDANENEMPEEALRLEVEKKRKELHDLMEKFQEMNLKEKQKAKKVEQGQDQEEKPPQEQQQKEDNVKEYHFQRRTVNSTSPYHRSQGGDAYASNNSRRTHDQEEYHGGDARRYNSVERPSYARRSRYDDRYNDSDRYPDAARGRNEQGYYRGGRGRGGRGGRYGGRGGSHGGGGRYYHRDSDLGGYGRRGYNDGDGERRGQCRSGHHSYEEHWSLCN